MNDTQTKELEMLADVVIAFIESADSTPKSCAALASVVRPYVDERFGPEGASMFQRIVTDAMLKSIEATMEEALETATPSESKLMRAITQTMRDLVEETSGAKA